MNLNELILFVLFAGSTMGLIFMTAAYLDASEALESFRRGRRK